MAENILEKIIKKKVEKIENLKKTTKLDTLNELIDKNKSFIDFKDKIQKNINNRKFVFFNIIFYLFFKIEKYSV